jgi:hypothetical protein
MRVNTIALETSTTAGGRNNTGCRQMAAEALCMLVRTRSAASATTIGTAGKPGP